MLLSIFIFLTLSYADDSKFDSRVLPQTGSYTTMDQAAVVALRSLASISKHIEYGGCIFETYNQYFFSQAIQGDSDSFRAICIGVGSIVAIYHTHPMGWIQGISGNDIKVATTLQKVSYVGLTDLNRIVKFVPGKTRSECLSSRVVCSDKSRMSHGEFVDTLDNLSN